jgi:hypothetical protein
MIFMVSDPKRKKVRTSHRPNRTGSRFKGPIDPYHIPLAKGRTTDIEALRGPKFVCLQRIKGEWTENPYPRVDQGKNVDSIAKKCTETLGRS